ncbi:hypothetical protein FCH28_09140 [Streptomyces piniterrae]|uniref:Uncharacterized protein n=1 Tax=Streptomyces piniterrae TaxID=2571125 RepID=A0A4U0NMJ8_9ACTN|nr:DUF6243 family protein [Streptomyces piniterrae]TJZ55510.1 hypothetical protein FCH28_09140 [Streptomyces piniterrae]
MSKGNAGGMLGVGGTRSKLSRGALRGGGGGGRNGGGRPDPQAQRRELLRRLEERSRGGSPDRAGDG